MEFIRNFTVEGRLECNFAPNGVSSNVYMPNLDVELWHKAPLDIFFLGKGTTDAEGYFTVDIEGNYDFIDEGKIDNIFMRVYYNGVLINPEEGQYSDSYNDDFNNDFS